MAHLGSTLFVLMSMANHKTFFHTTVTKWCQNCCRVPDQLELIKGSLIAVTMVGCLPYYEIIVCKWNMKHSFVAKSGFT